jgi:hypothetical protein
MAKKSFFVGMLVMVLAFGMVVIGCASTATPITGPNPFLGTWDGGMHGTIVFNSDGTGKQSFATFTYTVDGNTAQVRAGFIVKATVTAIINGDSLVFQGVTFKKKD